MRTFAVPFRFVCALSAISGAVCGVSQTFPEWRGSNTLVRGLWIKSPIVAVGEMINSKPYSEQTVDHLPWPMSPDVHRLKWCESDFRTIAVVKGTLPSPSKKYLWVTVFRECKLWDDDPAVVYHRFKTRVWFLREEGDFLRPTYDGGTAKSLGFFAKWDNESRLPAREQLGKLLLTPSANSDNLRQYANYLWDLGDIACDLPGKAECVREIRSLAKAGNVELRESACNFVKFELLEEGCH